MKYSNLFGKTQLTTPHDADSVNAKVLTQAGFIDKLGAGIYNILPLGQRMLQKINQIIREEMNSVGGQEILMPALHPIEIWNTSGRNRTMNEILFRTKGAGDRDFVFGPSHEETVTPLAAKFTKSYKDLPFSLYQLQTKFRNEPRAKSGLLRGREFGMKDMYSFHRDEKDLDEYYEKCKESYLRVYERCGLKAYVVEASGGAFSDKFSHEFSVITPAGEDTILVCEKCNIAQNLEIAEGKVPNPDVPAEKELPMEEVEIKRGFTVDDNAKAHKVGPEKILKTVVYACEDGSFIGVCIRGDLQINEDKLLRYLGRGARPASPDELKELGLVQGFISPVGRSAVEGGVKKTGKNEKIQLSFIGDHSIKNVKNFVTGANNENLDLVNVNLGRDFNVDDFSDFTAVKEGFACVKCGSHLKEEKAIEAGNIFKLGTKFSKDFNLAFTDEDGKRKDVVMGCYGIGNTRLMGTIVEASHDAKGMILPKSVAPYLVHLLNIGPDEKAGTVALNLYDSLTAKGIEVLFDDRNESAGKKLNDADLIGLPIRILVSKRSLESDSVEWKLRSSEDSELVNLTDLEEKILNYLA